LQETLSSYWVNFAKTGDSNGPGLPTSPAFDEKVDNSVLYIGAQPKAGPVPNRAWLEFLGTVYRSRAPAK
jgi:para-nitrobenzyl esterase